MPVDRLLRAAAVAGDAVTISYYEAPESERLRIVIPVAVRGEMLDAIVDPSIGSRAVFKLRKIASVRCADGRFALNPLADRPSRMDLEPIW